MFYLAVDQHHKQLTISLRNEGGEVVQRRQVSTQPGRVREFLQQMQERTAADGGYVTILEVCGFNDWLLRLLKEYGCRQVVLIQPEKQSKKKTDRRDANALGELLWVNRQRLLAGQKIQGVRQVEIVSEEELADRRLTAARQRLGQQRTRTINRIHQILRRHNLEWECPTKTFDTQAVRRWLPSLELPAGERLEMDQLLVQWRQWDEQLEQLETRIQQRCEGNPVAQILMTIVGVSYFAALALASRINDIARFPRPRSLANYFGLTPGCRNSGESTDRLGSITKQGSAIARFILGQLVLHVLKRDGRMRSWYQRIKRRRGAKIARVAVMRRLATILWHMVKHQQPYQYQRVPRPCTDQPQSAMDAESARRHQAEVFAQLGIRRPAADPAAVVSAK
jgi:transposase